MQKINKIENIFGPVGTISGYIIAIVGVVVLFSSLKGLVFMSIGLFVGFTANVAYVDFDKKRCRNAIKLFGVFPVGKWVDIDKSMVISLKKSTKAWRTYSMTNRTYDHAAGDFKIELLDKNKKVIGELERFNKLDEAKTELSLYSERLNLPII
ncbi:MAG: hypothetical protein PWR03_1295 [Tenuifilum sp.]|jgi:hypothetical protein|uniref:hypothetical protein n=1 Tax=Tenuifilum sp. TaxID=2760880 RepID=UPI0024AB13C4|nr:hypothetical protein [Tenuifilum sp.]MDI3527112.1 hypothetical protein [Tenuifilum sp.]